MKNLKKMTAFALCLALLTGVSACGSKTEDPERTLPEEEVTDVTTTAEETDEETAESETETETAEETAETETETETETADDTADTTETTAEGETTAAATDADAPAQTDAPAAQTDAPATQAPAADPTPAPTEAPAPQSTASEITFEYGGSSINLGDNAQGFTAAVPSNSQESAPSCLGNGDDINYYYNDFTLYVWNVDGSYELVGVDITGTGASTSRGITIGSKAEDVTGAYGTGYTEQGNDFVYDFGNNCSLRFTMNDGAVVYISYNKEN